MINHQNFSTAYPFTSKVSLDELNGYATIPIKDTHRDFEKPYFKSNPSLKEWKNRLCENNNQAGNNIGIPFVCGSPKNNEQKENDNQQNEDISDKLNGKIGKLKEKLNESIFGNGEKGKSQSEDLELNSEEDNENDDDDKDEKSKFLAQQQFLEQQGENNAKGKPNDNNGNNGNNDSNDNDDNNFGVTELDLDIEKKLSDADKKIENLRKKINNKNNNLFFGQHEENKGEDKNNREDNTDGDLWITGLDLKIQKIEANADKRIQKLIDKIENDKDNQRLIDQREEDEAKDDDDEDDSDDDADDSKDDDGKTYEGYGFNGGNDGDNDNGDDNGKDNDDKNFNFATAGDFGCSKNTQDTVANIEKQDPELVLALGDLSYHSAADCWFDIMSSLKGKIMVTLGHHDIKDGQAKMNQYVNSFELDKHYYSYDYKHVHFLVMASLADYEEGSAQYNFIKQDLEKASQNKDINWIIVSTYKPFYSSPSEHKADSDLRTLYSPLFEKYGVDLVLNGHNHNYQRTYPLTYNPNEGSKPIATNAFTTGYNSHKDGIVYATVGTGGVNFYSLEGRDPYMATQFAGKFGFLNIDISNGNPHMKLTGTFYDNKGSQIVDEFTIEKEIKNKNTEAAYS